MKTVKTVIMTFRVTPDTKNWYEKFAKNEDLDTADILRRALREFRAKEEAKNVHK